MKNILTFILLLLMGCKSPNEQEGTQSVQTNSVKTEIIEEPLSIDSNFFEFMIQFSSDKDFQLKRSNIQNWKYFNFYEKQDANYLINASQKDFGKDRILERNMVLIDLKTNKRIEFQFKKERDIWYLTSENESIFDITSDTTFENFLYNFSKDTNYRKSHIKYPLKYSILGDDFEPNEKFITLGEEYEFDIFNYDKFLYFKEARKTESNKINIWISGIDNGIMVSLNFERIKGKWYLTEHEDSST